MSFPTPTQSALHSLAQASASLERERRLRDDWFGLGPLYMRMRLNSSDKPPFDFLTTHRQDDRVFVFVVQNGSAVVIEDEAVLYPSDHLITKLNLIRRKP